MTSANFFCFLTENGLTGIDFCDSIVNCIILRFYAHKQRDGGELNRIQICSIMLYRRSAMRFAFRWSFWTEAR